MALVIHMYPIKKKKELLTLVLKKKSATLEKVDPPESPIFGELWNYRFHEEYATETQISTFCVCF